MGSGPVQKQSADDQLMRAFGNDDEALQELFIRFGSDVCGIGRRCFLDADLADAVVERTFVRMWHRSSQYASSSVPLEPWVMSQALAVALQMSASHPGEPARAGSVGRTETDGGQPAVA
jgi:DNA-directed RNA polymerase specialized sigma24 family protein